MVIYRGIVFIALSPGVSAATDQEDQVVVGADAHRKSRLGHL